LDENDEEVGDKEEVVEKVDDNSGENELCAEDDETNELGKPY